MTDGLIEKVAKAIFLKEGRNKDVAWEDADRVLALFPGKERVSDYYRGIARAAIEAMRVPTKGMEEAGEGLDDWGCPSDPGSGNASALAHWTAMIDVALSEGAEEVRARQGRG